MESSKLLTRKDLAARWQVSERTIDQYRENGIIVPVKNIPTVRFNLQYIEKIEGYIPEKTTLRERKLEQENKDLRKEIENYKSIIAGITSLVGKVFVKMSEE